MVGSRDSTSRASLEADPLTLFRLQVTAALASTLESNLRDTLSQNNPAELFPDP